MPRRLTRRSMLRGAAGAALALPALEAMMPRSAKANEGGIPKRYIFCYAGTSSGRYRTPDEGEILVPGSYGALSSVGAQMHSLQPVFAEGVADDISLVSNLLIPWGNEGGLAPGGRVTSLDFHFGPTVTPQLSGMKALAKARMDGPSSDQLMVESLAPDTILPSLSQRVQPIDYRGGNGGSAGRISFKRDGGSVVPIDPFVSPRDTFDFLNSVYLPPDASPELIAAIDRRASVLDEVGGAANALMAELGTADRIRLQRHLHEVELLESQLRASTDGSGACMGPQDPGPDPALGGTIEADSEFTEDLAWSDEDARAQRQSELLRMALSCDLTRYGALQMTNWKSWMGASSIGAGWDIDIHEIGHTGAMPKEAMGDVVGWHVGHFARLVRLLKETPEWDGSSLLDHTALVLCFEGGHGEDPVDGGYSTHSTQNMSVLVAGNVGGLVAGQHINGQEMHPAQATLSAMRAAGYQGNFGDFSEGIPGLLG
ncbi:MAG: DUF1552 domain-containing protein [Myxococcota bacterium]